MAAVDDVDELIKRYHLAQGEFYKGNPEPVKDLYSHREEVTLANPLVGLPAIGWERVAETVEHASAQIRDGEVVAFENAAKYVTPELAYVVEIERGSPRSAAGKIWLRVLSGLRWYSNRKMVSGR